MNHELLWLGVSLATAAGIAAYIALGLPLPTCHFHNITGIACLTCGATRSLLQLVAGNFREAFLFNPLIFAVLSFAIIYNVYAAIVLVFRLPRLRIIHISAPVTKYMRFAIISALLMNWAYVASRL